MRNPILLKWHCFENVRWNADLDFLGEHHDFYLQLAQAGLKGAFTPDSIHLHRDDLKNQAVSKEVEFKWRHDKQGEARKKMALVFDKTWRGPPKVVRDPARKVSAD